MGIKNLNTLLKDLCSNAIEIKPLSDWSGKRMAIDLNNLIYIYISTAWKEVVNTTKIPFEEPDTNRVVQLYLDRFKQLMMRLFRNKITPVIVCDGAPPPEKETITRTKRREDRDNAKARCDELQLTLMQKDPLDITPHDIDLLKTYMRQNTPVSTRDIETIKTVLSGIGVPILQCNSEAEVLCSLLCRTGRVDLVYSTDTDNIVHGCPNLVTEFKDRTYDPSRGEMVDQIKVTNFHRVLEGLELTYPQFVDVCIMSGCDYNVNIPRIGVKTSYKLIKEHGSIDNLPSKYDISYLNHVRCRQLFAHYSYASLCENGDASLNLDISSLSSYARDVLEPYGVDHWISDLVEIYRDFPQPPVEIILAPMAPLPQLIILNENDNDVADSEENNDGTANDNHSHNDLIGATATIRLQ